MNIFDTYISATINGDEIDTPKNAITQSKSLHAQFGSFNVFFDEIPNKPHAYRIDSYKTNVRFAFGFPKKLISKMKTAQTSTLPAPDFWEYIELLHKFYICQQLVSISIE